MSKLPPKRVPPSPSKVAFRLHQVSTNDSQQRKSVYISFKIGDRVITSDKKGTIAFIGPTKFAEGEWIGINLDEPLGRNDGSYDGIRYFETDANHGLFCKPEKVQHLPINGSLQRNSHYDLSRQSAIEGASNNVLGITTIDKDDLASPKNLQLGDRVVVRGEKFGMIKYIGKIHLDDGLWCGVKLDGPFGKHDGKVDGVRYFRCSHRFGLFAPLRHVEKLLNDPKDRRQSVLSTDSNSQNRDSPIDASNLSEFSVSSGSTSTSHFSPRLPKVARQISLTTDLTPMETSLSNQVAQLQERIREKDVLIRKLEQKTEKDRLEDFRTAEKINDMEKQMTQLQQKYDTTENENLNLIREQFELKQRLDELQDGSNISDDCYLLSSQDIELFENTKDRVIQLESANQKLIQENHRLQEELLRYHQLKDNQLIKQIESLKLQITDLQNREQFVKTQLNEKEMLYQRQMNELLNELKRYKEIIVPDLEKQCQHHGISNGQGDHYETQIKEYEDNLNRATRETQQIQAELVKLEEEKIVNENKTKTIINSLKRDYETQFETLKHQLTEFQDQERIANYQIELKQYQMQLDDANHQIEKLHDELKSLHDEKTSQEEELKQTITALQLTEKQLQADIDELNDRERKVNRNIHQRDEQFDQQINEYEQKLEQVNLHNQQLQSELEKLQEEKTHFNETINTITHDLETLKTELQNRDQNDNEYKSKTDQSLLEIQHITSKLRTIEDEKTNMENELNNTIDTLKQEFENHQHQRELQANETFHQRELEFEQQIKDYQEKLEHLQSESENSQQEKHQVNDTIDALGQELQALRIELQDREHAHNTTTNDLKNHYESQINDLQLQLTNSHEEKTTIENTLHEQLNTLKQDYDKFQNEQKHKEKSIQARYEQEFDEYQKNLELSIHRVADMQSELVNSQEEKEANEKLLNEKIESMKNDFAKRIKAIETEKTKLEKENRSHEERLQEYETTMDETNQLFQQVEDITKLNEQLKKELRDLKNKYDPKEMEELSNQVTVLQQMHLNLLEKQAIKEQEYQQDKQAQEKIYQGKIQEFEMKIALMKSEHMVEMENVKLDRDQEIIRLRALIPKPPPPKGKK